MLVHRAFWKIFVLNNGRYASAIVPPPGLGPPASPQIHLKKTKKSKKKSIFSETIEEFDQATLNKAEVTLEVLRQSGEGAKPLKEELIIV